MAVQHHVMDIMAAYAYGMIKAGRRMRTGGITLSSPSTAVALPPRALPGRKAMLLMHYDPEGEKATVVAGGRNVTVADGYVLVPNTALYLEVTDLVTVFVATDSASAAPQVRFLEIGP